MGNERLYRVKIELDVTARSEEEATAMAVSDIVELQSEGSLDAAVTDLSKDLVWVMDAKRFTTQERMAEIANAAIDSFGEMLNGQSLYECLTGSLKMSDDEILAAGLTTLKEFMKED